MRGSNAVSATILVFVYGVVAGFLLTRLRGNRPLPARQEVIVVNVARAFAPLSLTLAVCLFSLAAWTIMGGARFW